MGSFDSYCAICGGPCCSVNIRSYNRLLDPQASGGSGSDADVNADENADENADDVGVLMDDDGDDEWDDDDESEISEDDEEDSDDGYDCGYDSKIIKPSDAAWVEDCRVLGFNDAVDGLSKAFVSGPGHYDDFGSMTCVPGTDPNCQGLNIPALSCYHDFNNEDPVFPFHWDCFELLCKRLTGSADITRIDKDVLYSVMRSLAPDYCNSLNLDYDEPNTDIYMPDDQFWESSRGEELYVVSPKQSLRLDARVRADVERSFTLPALESGSMAKVRSDPFSKLPSEVIHEIVSLLDHEALVGLLKASWPVHYSCHDDNTFWKQRIKNQMPWFFELQSLLLSPRAESIGSMKALYLWAQERTKPRFNLTGPYMALANRRRIWGVCDQLADLYLPKLPKIDLGISDTLRSQATCPHMPVVSAPISNKRNDEQVFWVRVWDELYFPKTVETFWDSDGFLVGISVSTNDQRRLFGVDDSQAGVQILSFNLENNVWIDGIVLHIPQMSLELDPRSSLPSRSTHPVNSIRGVTFRTSGGKSIDLGQTTSGFCQRPFLSPQSHRIFGLIGQTGFIDEKPRILRLGLLLIPTTSPEDHSLRTPAPPLDPLQRYLLTDQSCRIMGRPIWECEELKIRTFPGQLTQPPHYDFHVDTIPYEAFIWARNEKESRELRSITVHVFQSGTLSSSKNGLEITTSICNIRANLNPVYNQDAILARLTQDNGKAFPEFESHSFEIDGAGGERIIEISVQAEAHVSAVGLRTNHDRKITWQGQKKIGNDWKVVNIPEGEIIVGLLLAFGDPCGYENETRNYTREHTRLTYLAALTIKE